MIIVDDLHKVQRALLSISKWPSFNQNAKYIILFNNPEKRNGAETQALEILTLMFIKFHAVNVVIAIASASFSYEIYTGDPYHGSKNDCGKMKMVDIGQFISTNLTNPPYTKHLLGMEKVPQTMENCTFKMCARVSRPFVNEDCKDGLEIEIIHFLQNVMNFKIEIICSDETMERGEKEDDGSWSHLLGQIRDDECDIIVGSFFPDPDVHADFASTEFYLQDYYTWFVDLAPYEPRWKGLIFIFKPYAWTALGCIIIISWLAWLSFGYLTNESIYHQQTTTTFLNSFAVFLGVSAHNRPKFSTLRLFFIMLALYGLTVTTIYTSKLITVFTNPTVDHQIDSVHEILLSELPFGGRLETMDWFDNDDVDDHIIFKNYNHSLEFEPSDETMIAIMNNEKVVLLSRK